MILLQRFLVAPSIGTAVSGMFLARCMHQSAYVVSILDFWTTSGPVKDSIGQYSNQRNPLPLRQIPLANYCRPADFMGLSS